MRTAVTTVLLLAMLAAGVLLVEDGVAMRKFGAGATYQGTLKKVRPLSKDGKPLRIDFEYQDAGGRSHRDTCDVDADRDALDGSLARGETLTFWSVKGWVVNHVCLPEGAVHQRDEGSFDEKVGALVILAALVGLGIVFLSARKKRPVRPKLLG